MGDLWGPSRGYDRAIVYWEWWQKRKNTMRWAESDNNIYLGSLTTAEPSYENADTVKQKLIQGISKLELFLESGRLTMDILGMKKKTQ